MIVRDSFIVLIMQERAKERARNRTGVAACGNVVVRYYPACGRFAWFDETGPITKELAGRLLKAAWSGRP